MNNHNKFVVALIWFMTGYLCWLTGVYAFSYGTANLLLPTTKYLKSTVPQMVTLGHFILFHFTDFILIFLFAFAISVISGKKLFWLICFLAWPVGYSIYGLIRSIAAYMNYYAQLPSWVITWFIQAVIAYVLISPIVAWVGTILGNKWYIKRRQIQQENRGDRQ